MWFINSSIFGEKYAKQFWCKSEGNTLVFCPQNALFTHQIYNTLTSLAIAFVRIHARSAISTASISSYSYYLVLSHP
jgi:hypothetical protein